MPSYFPKALLFKELRFGRWYLALGTLFFSLGPLMYFVTTLSFSQAFIDQSPLSVARNVMRIDLPGLGFLLIIYSAGLALLSLSEFYRKTGIQLASEPIPLKSILISKFFIGMGTIVFSQTATSLWLWGALNLRHAEGPFLLIYGDWLIRLMMELAFYCVTFVLVLIVRPVVIGLLLMIALVIAPLYAAEWFLAYWKHYLPGGYIEMNAPPWALSTYQAIQDFSPYGIIHFGPDFMVQSPASFTIHAVEPFAWTILALVTVVWISRTHPSMAEHLRSSGVQSSQQRRPLVIVRALSTLGAAVILERFVVLHTHIERLGTKVIVILFLWMCCHWSVRAFLGSREMGRSYGARGLMFGSLRGGTRG